VDLKPETREWRRLCTNVFGGKDGGGGGGVEEEDVEEEEEMAEEEEVLEEKDEFVTSSNLCKKSWARMMVLCLFRKCLSMASLLEKVLSQLTQNMMTNYRR
jgi:hypothetical protein